MAFVLTFLTGLVAGSLLAFFAFVLVCSNKER